MRDFLFSSEEVHGTYVGFASNAFCYSPSVNKPYFKVESQSDSFKCDKPASIVFHNIINVCAMKITSKVQTINYHKIVNLENWHAKQLQLSF